MLMALALAALSVVLVGTRNTYTAEPPQIVHGSLRPSLGSYLGVYEPGSARNFQPIQKFAGVAGRMPNIAEYFSGWIEPFEWKFADTLHSHGIVPFVEIDPTDASISSIARGDYDNYLKLYGESVADFAHPVVIGFGEEMNATWYPWGYKRVPARTFVSAWRHLVTVFRGEGADNVTWLWTIQAYAKGVASAQPWWPGADYVTWVGIDGFYAFRSDTFNRLFGPTITNVRSFTSKPVLLSETAVAPGASQFVQISDLFRGMAADKTLGLVWFDASQSGSAYRQDWRIEDNREAEISFKLGVADDIGPAPTGSGRA